VQPLPDDLAPLMARGYRRSDLPPQGFFESIAMSPAGALSSTGTDMGRFIRALMNGGTLDGVRIRSKARLDEMTAPGDATPGHSLGLVFFRLKVAGHEVIEHGGARLSFFSSLSFFPEQGIGIFVSRNGIGDIKKPQDVPNPAAAVARRLLPKPQDAKPPEAANARAVAFGSDGLAGTYHASRRGDSSAVRMNELMSQLVIRVDGAGDLGVSPAIWPFAGGRTLKRVDRDVFDGPGGGRIVFVNEAGGRLRALFRCPGYAPAARPLVSGRAMDLARACDEPGGRLSDTASLARCRAVASLAQEAMERGPRRPGRVSCRAAGRACRCCRHCHRCRLFFAGRADPATLNQALDPLILLVYPVAWLGVFGVALTVSFAALFLAKGCRSCIHHTLIAASSVMLAWFFVTFHIAGTTLNY
jgi:hypothetical protein